MKIEKTKPSIIKKLYQMLYDIHVLLTNFGIKYFINDDTLLGCIRNKGIMPWDYDIDIGIFNKDVDKLLSLKKQFKKCGYDMEKVYFGYKLWNNDLHLDIYVYRKVDDLFELAYKKARDKKPNYEFYNDELLPLKLYKFGSFEVYGPKNPEEYFDRKYGKDWDEYAYFNDEKIKLTNSMRQAAKPKEVVDKKCVSQCILKVKNMPDVKSYLAKKTKTCSRTGVCYNNFIEKMGVYVINCQMHKVRYDKFKDYANKAGLKACRIPCVLGSKFTNEILCEMVDKKLLSKTADMNAIEVSINMSHFNAWQKISNSCLKYGLILEDDVEVTEDFIDRVNEILEKLEEKDISFSILHLWNGNWMKTLSEQKKVLKIDQDIEILKETVKYNAGAAAYIISKDYINFLIERFFPIKDPNDIFVGSYPKHGNHLTLKMTYDKKQKCYVSPLLDMPCGGEGGTGSQTTQVYDAPTMKEKSCKKC